MEVHYLTLSPQLMKLSVWLRDEQANYKLPWQRPGTFVGIYDDGKIAVEWADGITTSHNIADLKFNWNFCNTLPITLQDYIAKLDLRIREIQAIDRSDIFTPEQIDIANKLFDAALHVPCRTTTIEEYEHNFIKAMQEIQSEYQERYPDYADFVRRGCGLVLQIVEWDMHSNGVFGSW
jgi:hypothetical protein